MSNFQVIAREGKARAGILKTAHGEVETPIFMPVGTQASVKSLSPDDLKMNRAEIILGNTYHLYLRPGSKLIKKMGGLHKFMNWNGPILTDSGGFQAFSLGAMIEHGVKKIEKGSGVEGKNMPADGKITPQNDIVVYSSVKKNRENNSKRGREVLSKITEAGVEFKSHLDGSKHLLTPEKSIEVQLDLGSDIVLVLDELLSPLHNPEYVKQSLDRTHRWEIRSQKFFKKNVKKSTNPKAMLFGIVQGVYDKEIREQEAKWVTSQDFDGISIGGSCGTSEFWGQDQVNFWSTKAIYQTMGWITPLLPEELPRHALGIGEVVDFFECVERGIDMFDCVAPMRRARNGSLYISPKNGGKASNSFSLIVSNNRFREDKSAIDKNCACYTCSNFTLAYLRHLFITHELLYYRLATIHNVYFMINLTKQIRISIINNSFKKLKKSWLGS